jgi:hypothetical protein
LKPQSIVEKNSILILAILLVLSLIAGYLLVEASYRWYLYRHYTVQAGYLVMTTDVPPVTTTFGQPGSVFGVFAAAKPFTLTIYAPDGTMFDRHRVPVNNLGWVSEYDYARQKVPSEYRIAVVGDSLTASINNSQPWPDALQRKLNADKPLLAKLGVQKISVLNLGVAGASMGMMANPLAVIAHRFSPDMLVVNFVIEDLPRPYSDDYKIMPQEPTTPPIDTSTETEIKPFLIKVDGMQIPISCASLPQDLSNPDCKVSVMWYVPQDRVFDKDSINHIKFHAAKEIVWHRVTLSKEPLVWRQLFGEPIIQQATTALPTPHIISENRDEKERTRAVNVLKFIYSINQNVLVLHNPLYPHMKGKTYIPDVTLASALDPLVEEAHKSGIEITRVDQYMPVEKGEKEWKRWYNLPNDGHWSDYGAEVYASAVYTVIRQRLLANK